MNNKPITLVHLTLKHVYEDQLRLKGESERKESELKKMSKRDQKKGKMKMKKKIKR